LLDLLVRRGELTAEEARLAVRVPVAEDITVEADSGGHTDNRPLVALLPVIMALRNQICLRHGYVRPVRVGAAGGLGTPAGVAAAFGMGAAYVLTGSVNQSCVESGLSADGKAMLTRAGIVDVVMAPAADMFELGVKLQVLRGGTMFASRAAQLYELYRAHGSLAELGERDRQRLERDVFGMPLERVWEQTAGFWAERDPGQVERA
jgi:PfaD family protein